MSAGGSLLTGTMTGVSERMVNSPICFAKLFSSEGFGRIFLLLESTSGKVKKQNTITTFLLGKHTIEHNNMEELLDFFGLCSMCKILDLFSSKKFWQKTHGHRRTRYANMPENHTFLGGSGLIIPKEVGFLGGTKVGSSRIVWIKFGHELIESPGEFLRPQERVSDKSKYKLNFPNFFFGFFQKRIFSTCGEDLSFFC